MCPPAPSARPVDVELEYRSPCDVEGLLGFLSARAIPGIEAVLDGAYHRSLRLPGGSGVVALRAGAGRVRATFWLEDPGDLDVAIARCRCLLDLDADPEAILRVLCGDPVIRDWVAAAPGRRVPGHVDAVELAARAVLGQQVSVAGAATLAGRLVARYGDLLPARGSPVTHLFPSAAALAKAAPQDLPLPRSRGTALTAVADALASGGVRLDGAMAPDEARRRLLEMPGLGPWTVGYIAMRALGDRDVFLATDLGVRRGLRALGRDERPQSALAVAERWRPYRAYGMLALWAGPPEPGAAG